jgi:hypothetical protein
MNERGRTIPAVFPSYLGFAQALIEGNYPFDVLFAGDGHYVQDRLTKDQLESYKTILVPSPIEPTDHQKRVIQKFVSAGGTIVCHEPEKLGLSRGSESAGPVTTPCLEGQFTHGRGRVLLLSGRVSNTWTDDTGSNFFKTYDPNLRAQVGHLAGSLGLVPVLSGQSSALASAFLIAHPEKKRLLVHLVNYDIDYEKDKIREQTGLVVNLARAGFLPDDVRARLYVPGEPTRTLDTSNSKGHLSFSLPPLGVSAVVVISAP